MEKRGYLFPGAVLLAPGQLIYIFVPCRILGAVVELADGYVQARTPNVVEGQQDYLSLCFCWRNRKCYDGGLSCDRYNPACQCSA